MDFEQFLFDMGLTVDRTRLQVVDFHMEQTHFGPSRLSVEFIVRSAMPRTPPVIPSPAPQWPPPVVAQVTGTRKRSDASPLKERS